MPPKKKGKGKKKDDKNVPKKPLVFEPVIYITNKPATMIDMLNSQEPKVLLRVIGTLHKAVVTNETNLKYLLHCGLYDKLLELLKSSDIYILRFAISFVQKVIAKVIDFSQNLELPKMLTTAALVKELYLCQNDDLVKTLSLNTLLNLAKFNQIISKDIYSDDIVKKIFESLKVDKKLELAVDNMSLFFYIIDSAKAERNILTCSGFSIVALLCLFESNELVLKQLAIDILHKLAMWKRNDMLLELAKAKVAEAMTRLLMSELQNYCEKAFETAYACLSVNKCANSYVKSLEFVKYLEWVKICPKTLVASASSILRSLSTHEDLLQILFDFSMEESAVCLFRFVNEAVILNVCDVIVNMMRHRYCCEKMATPALMKTLIEIVNDDDLFSTLPYGEIALKTLHRFFFCYVNTVERVYESGCINTLVDIFSKSKSQMSRDGYIHIIEIMQVISKSQYSETIRNVTMYHSIIDFYMNSSFEDGKLLIIMESFFDCDEFRLLFLEYDVLSAMMNKIMGRKDIESSTEILLAIRKLITFKKIGLFFIDQGYFAQLRFIKDNYKFDTSIVDQIINALFDFCLTHKFFYKRKLYENDKIRDSFFLIPDMFMSIPSDKINFKSKKLSEHIPIYTVILQEFYFTEDQNAKSVLDIDFLDLPLFTGSRRLAQRKTNLSPFHRLAEFAGKYFKSADDIASILSCKTSSIGDGGLAKIIGDINDEIHVENKPSYSKLQSRVKYIAACINSRLSDSKTLETHFHRQHAFCYHIRKLISALDSNFIPIGHLKMGFQCERALLFKVICDQVKVPTTLCKEGNSYFNEIGIFKKDIHFRHGYLVQKMFIVDLMENIGDLMPAESNKAKAYLKRHEAVF